jgi:hypothetical protein
VTTGVGVGVTTGFGVGVGVTTGFGVGVGVTTGFGVTTGVGFGAGVGVAAGVNFLYSVKVISDREHKRPVEVTVTETTGSFFRFVTFTIPALSMRATPAEELTAH